MENIFTSFGFSLSCEVWASRFEHLLWLFWFKTVRKWHLPVFV